MAAKRNSETEWIEHLFDHVYYDLGEEFNASLDEDQLDGPDDHLDYHPGFGPLIDAKEEALAGNGSALWKEALRHGEDGINSIDLLLDDMERGGIAVPVAELGLLCGQIADGLSGRLDLTTYRWMVRRAAEPPMLAELFTRVMTLSVMGEVALDSEIEGAAASARLTSGVLAVLASAEAVLASGKVAWTEVANGIEPIMAGLDEVAARWVDCQAQPAPESVTGSPAEVEALFRLIGRLRQDDLDGTAAGTLLALCGLGIELLNSDEPALDRIVVNHVIQRLIRAFEDSLASGEPPPDPATARLVAGLWPHMKGGLSQPFAVLAWVSATRAIARWMPVAEGTGLGPFADSSDVGRRADQWKNADEAVSDAYRCATRAALDMADPDLDQLPLSQQIDVALTLAEAWDRFWSGGRNDAVTRRSKLRSLDRRDVPEFPWSKPLATAVDQARPHHSDDALLLLAAGLENPYIAEDLIAKLPAPQAEGSPATTVVEPDSAAPSPSTLARATGSAAAASKTTRKRLLGAHLAELLESGALPEYSGSAAIDPIDRRVDELLSSYDFDVGAQGAKAAYRELDAERKIERIVEIRQAIGGRWRVARTEDEPQALVPLPAEAAVLSAIEPRDFSDSDRRVVIDKLMEMKDSPVQQAILTRFLRDMLGERPSARELGGIVDRGWLGQSRDFMYAKFARLPDGDLDRLLEKLAIAPRLRIRTAYSWDPFGGDAEEIPAEDHADHYEEFLSANLFPSLIEYRDWAGHCRALLVARAAELPALEPGNRARVACHLLAAAAFEAERMRNGFQHGVLMPGHGEQTLRGSRIAIELLADAATLEAAIELDYGRSLWEMLLIAGSGGLDLIERAVVGWEQEPTAADFGKSEGLLDALMERLGGQVPVGFEAGAKDLVARLLRINWGSMAPLFSDQALQQAVGTVSSQEKVQALGLSPEDVNEIVELKLATAAFSWWFTHVDYFDIEESFSYVTKWIQLLGQLDDAAFTSLASDDMIGILGILVQYLEDYYVPDEEERREYALEGFPWTDPGPACATVAIRLVRLMEANADAEWLENSNHYRTFSSLVLTKYGYGDGPDHTETGLRRPLAAAVWLIANRALRRLDPSLRGSPIGAVGSRFDETNDSETWFDEDEDWHERKSLAEIDAASVDPVYTRLHEVLADASTKDLEPLGPRELLELAITASEAAARGCWPFDAERDRERDRRGRIRRRRNHGDQEDARRIHVRNDNLTGPPNEMSRFIGLIGDREFDQDIDLQIRCELAEDVTGGLAVELEAHGFEIRPIDLDVGTAARELVRRARRMLIDSVSNPQLTTIGDDAVCAILMSEPPSDDWGSESENHLIARMLISAGASAKDVARYAGCMPTSREFVRFAMRPRLWTVLRPTSAEPHPARRAVHNEVILRALDGQRGSSPKPLSDEDRLAEIEWALSCSEVYGAPPLLVTAARPLALELLGSSLQARVSADVKLAAWLKVGFMVPTGRGDADFHKHALRTLYEEHMIGVEDSVRPVDRPANDRDIDAIKFRLELPAEYWNPDPPSSRVAREKHFRLAAKKMGVGFDSITGAAVNLRSTRTREASEELLIQRTGKDRVLAQALTESPEGNAWASVRNGDRLFELMLALGEQTAPELSLSFDSSERADRLQDAVGRVVIASLSDLLGLTDIESADADPEMRKYLEVGWRNIACGKPARSRNPYLPPRPESSLALSTASRHERSLRSVFHLWENPAEDRWLMDRINDNWEALSGLAVLLGGTRLTKIATEALSGHPSLAGLDLQAGRKPLTAGSISLVDHPIALARLARAFVDQEPWDGEPQALWDELWDRIGSEASVHKRRWTHGPGSAESWSMAVGFAPEPAPGGLDREPELVSSRWLELRLSEDENGRRTVLITTDLGEAKPSKAFRAETETHLGKVRKVPRSGLAVAFSQPEETAGDWQLEVTVPTRATGNEPVVEVVNRLVALLDPKGKAKARQKRK